MATDSTVSDESAVSMLGALAQATRFKVFRLLMKHGDAGLAAGAIAAELGVPQNTMSAHLSVLSNAGLIKSVRQGRSLVYSVRISDTRDFLDYLVHDCCNGHPEICAISVDAKDGCG
jgi:DNA-binding transcriptional ArsR family regulator